MRQVLLAGAALGLGLGLAAGEARSDRLAWQLSTMQEELSALQLRQPSFALAADVDKLVKDVAGPDALQHPGAALLRAKNGQGAAALRSRLPAHVQGLVDLGDNFLLG